MAENNGIVIDLSSWKMREKNAFMRLAGECAKTGDETPMYPAVAPLVKGWPYSGNPAEVASYDDLEIEQWQKVLDAVSDAIVARFQKAK